MNKPNYYISKDNAFVIENYNAAPAFSSFFPGIAGAYGCPMWVFYANRGQCITSAGIYDKDNAIIEFEPANKAYQSAALKGFRTFLKVDGAFYEPFCEHIPYKNHMKITPDRLELIEENTKLKIRVTVTYFTIAQEPFPALARIVRIKNLSKKPRKIEIIDGLPNIVPFGFNDDLLKKISQTIAAWCLVENLGAQAPFYKLKVMPADVCETKVIEKGNFYIPVSSQGKPQIIINPGIVFGEVTSFDFPANFIDAKNFKVPGQQITQGLIPSAFAYQKLQLKKGEHFELCCLLGQADSLKLLNNIKKKASSKKYFDKKLAENQALIDDICSRMTMRSSSQSFNLYSRQSFLDNTMRGGLPIDIDDKVVYTYYRKHGDMERDYNNFKLMPTYLSQGNGNYRDINQNRRNDNFFNPNVSDDNIIRFFNLIQLDGYNPLVVLGSQYSVKSADVANSLCKKHLQNAEEWLSQTLTKPFLLGVLLKNIEDAGIQYTTSRDAFAEDLLDHAEAEEGAVHSEGYWIDHFFYSLDLLESFENIYPEKVQDLLFSKKVFTFYDNKHVVQPRAERYCLSCGNIRQYESVKADPEKQVLINNRLSGHASVVRTDFGKGTLYQTTLASKLLCLVANKAASFDAEGIGLEMEAGKPDWYDALNGLPALFGSSLSETLELKRMCVYLLNHLEDGIKIDLPIELKEFIDRLNSKLAIANTFDYWDATNQIKEDYREKTRLGISGQETIVSSKYADGFLKNIIKKCDQAVKKCLKKYKNYYTYFINQVLEHETLVEDKIRVKKFTQKPLPLFLEGFVHALKVEKDKKIPKLVKKSPLYDKKLKMYKVNAPLKDAPIEIGRAKIFSPGWLENESVWLHMEYKYMLELLKAGLHQEFFAELKDVLVPFISPKKYKRSTLENSSFIASSAHPNQNIHGRGFYARLSGASAEFIEMWLLMTTGKNIFYLDQKGKLNFKLAPILPGWLFSKGELGFTLLGLIEVTYINKKGKDTFGPGVGPISYALTLEDKVVEINQAVVPEPYSRLIRERKVKKIVVALA